MQKRKHRYLAGIFTLLLLAIPVVGLLEHQAVFDAIRLHGYTAPDSISQLATDTAMQPSMRRLFYVYHPAIEDKTDFNKSCRDNEQTIVLGCYVDTRGIYLLNVTDSRLTGVEQVTAAHETLHAAYARLSTTERKRVDKLTADYFANATDQRLKDTIELYKKQDPSVVPNELHSILGTEVRTLPAELETYYKQYFSDRSKVVDFSEQYEKAFTERKNQIVAYDAQLSSLKEQIDSLQTSLTAQASSLSAERERLSGLRSSGQVAAYNAAVPGFNQQVNKYNQDIDTLSDIISEYNDIVPKRNAIAEQESDLVKAIDSRSSVPAHQ
ncbi:MAG: hypothetical protein JWO47_656 [Candidatus Saccharibacteria bacterium]|nr:hypothetical protein [Candidatus Saccharibacteria bacterium]